MDYHPGRINCGLISRFRRSAFPHEAGSEGTTWIKVSGVGPAKLSAGSWFGRSRLFLM
jgi:hypothetical protein